MLKAVKYKISEVPQRYWDFVHKYGRIYQSKPYLECLAASGREQVVVAVFELASVLTEYWAPTFAGRRRRVALPAEADAVTLPAKEEFKLI